MLSMDPTSATKLTLLSGEALLIKLYNLVPRTGDEESKDEVRRDVEVLAEVLSMYTETYRGLREQEEVFEICRTLHKLCHSKVLKCMHPLALVPYIARTEAAAFSNYSDRMITHIP